MDRILKQLCLDIETSWVLILSLAGTSKYPVLPPTWFAENLLKPARAMPKTGKCFLTNNTQSHVAVSGTAVQARLCKVAGQSKHACVPMYSSSRRLY